MLDRTFAWGKQTNNLRTNSVHGEEEVRMILSECFEALDKSIEEVDRSGTIHVEDMGFGFL